MTSFTSSLGVTRDVELDLDAIIDYEASHPDWTLKDVMDGITKLRFSDMNLMARFLGFASVKECMDLGFTLQDMSEMMLSSRYLGFTDSTPETEAD